MGTKLCVVTGASSGLGQAICKEYLEQGFKVYGISRTKPKFSSSKFIWLKLDLYKPEEIKDVDTRIKETKIDLLVNCAGTAKEKLAIDFTEEDFDYNFDLNFKAPIYLTKTLMSKLNNGSIINISSTSDRIPERMYALYCATKTSLILFFDSFAIEQDNIRILNILPDYINTPLLHRVLKDEKDFPWDIPMEPAKVAKAILIITENKNIKSGSQVIVASNKLQSAFKNREKLWGYNIDSKKLFEISNS